MKTHFLFPRKFKIVGWLFLSLGIVGLLFMDKSVAGLDLAELFEVDTFAVANGAVLEPPSYFSIIRDSIYAELVLALLILGGLFVGFSRHESEDEFISKIRYESLVWAVYFNFGLLLLSTLFIYGTYYMSVVMHNIFSLLIFFIVRFHIKLYQLKKSLGDDE